MVPYGTAKFKSANIFAMAIWRLAAKFNSHQYFRLYGIWIVICVHNVVCTIIRGENFVALPNSVQEQISISDKIFMVKLPAMPCSCCEFHGE